MVESPAELRCPKCLGDLDPGDGAVACGECGTSYPVSDGMFDLRCGRHDYYFNPLPPQEMEQLVRGMTRENWSATIRSFVARASGGAAWLDNLVVDGRYAWKLLLDLNRDTVLLDLGCGLGNLTHNLAPFVRRVYALDLTWQRLAFSRKRFDLFNAEDDIALVAGGDGPHLPFHDAALDCVVLSGVLEWVGEGDMTPFQEGSKPARLARMLAHHFGDRSPRQVQLRFLKEIRRVVKAGGQLFVAIENRLNYEYFKGRPDHHSGLKYGSLLPRLAANLYSIAVNRSPYRTFTYSLRGYKRLFAQAGFPNTEFLGFSRGYSSLEEILRAEVDVPWWRPDPPRGVKERLRRSKYFVPAYGIISSATPKPWRRVQDAVLNAVERELSRSIGAGALTVEHYAITGKDKLLVRASYGAKHLLMRIPLGPGALRLEQRNDHLLRVLANKGIRGVRVPRPLASGKVASQAYFVEERLHGQPLADVLPRTGRVAALGLVSKLLDALHPATPRVLQPLTGDLYEREVTIRLERLFQIVTDGKARRRAGQYFADRLRGVETAVGICHGDVSTSNILTDDDGGTGLIDWEGGSEEGLPILDALNYLIAVHIASHPADRLDRIVPLLAYSNWPSGEEWRFLMERYSALGMDPSQHEAWTYLKWLHGVGMLLEGTPAYDPSVVERSVTLVLETMLGRSTR
jgi:SAM-dependent methyltransferase/aminoglycoside phosphotransferase (APT) family kinase protein